MVALDTAGSDVAAMVEWLTLDLQDAFGTAKWIVALSHHPPYSKVRRRCDAGDLTAPRVSHC